MTASPRTMALLSPSLISGWPPSLFIMVGSGPPTRIKSCAWGSPGKARDARCGGRAGLGFEGTWGTMTRRATNISHHVNQNIETIAQLKEGLNRRAGSHQRAVERVTQWLGRPFVVYAVLAAILCWVLYNTLAPLARWHQVDPPPFLWLQGTMAVFDAVVALTVLTAQNRQDREAEQRAHLELQVSLLAEQKTTKIISLLEELRHDLPMVKDRKDRIADAMQERVDPQAVLSALEDTMGSPEKPPHLGNKASSVKDSRR